MHVSDRLDKGEVVAVRTKTDSNGKQSELYYNMEDIDEFSTNNEFYSCVDDNGHIIRQPTGVTTISIRFKQGHPPLWREKDERSATGG